MKLGKILAGTALTTTLLLGSCNNTLEKEFDYNNRYHQAIEYIDSGKPEDAVNLMKSFPLDNQDSIDYITTIKLILRESGYSAEARDLRDYVWENENKN